jgi:hypothetical protein
MHFSHPQNRHVRTPAPVHAVPHENLFREPATTLSLAPEQVRESPTPLLPF